MYKVTLILFTFFSLVFPILAAPTVLFPNEIHKLAQRDIRDFSDPTEGLRFSGNGIQYTPGLGACGKTNSSDQLVVSISPNKFGIGDQCGRTITIHLSSNDTSSDKSVQATIVDKCTDCGDQDINMSPAVFQEFGLKVNVIEVRWEFP